MNKYKKALQDFIVWAGYDDIEYLPSAVETLLASGLTPAEVQDLYGDELTYTTHVSIEVEVE